MSAGRLLIWAAALQLATAAPPLSAENAPATSAAALALYTGKDRSERLAAAAKKEGTLTFYTTFAERDLPALIKPFEDKYGVKVNVWRSGTDKILQRSIAEAGAHRYSVDVIHFGAPEMEALHREKILMPVLSPAYEGLRPGAVPPHHEWAATLLTVFVLAYNTHAVQKGELPARYADLLDPRWKGRLGIEAKSWDWFAAMVGQLGADAGVKLFHDITVRNGISVRQGHALLNNLVVSGEVPLALTIYNYMPEQAKRDGAPVDWFVIPPAVARANAIGVALHAPHPAAALLFEDYMLSAAQPIIARMDYVPTSTAVPSPMGNPPMVLVDPAQVLDQSDAWTRRFNETFIQR